MLQNYFKREHTRQYYYAGSAGPYLDEFSRWLNETGYQVLTIRRRIRGAAQFATWADGVGVTVPELDAEILTAFSRHLSKLGQLKYRSGYYTFRFISAQHFLSFLQRQGIVSATPTAASLASAQPELLSEFQLWLRVQRGICESTIGGYSRFIIELLQQLGDQPERFNAQNLRAFILRCASRQSQSSANNIVTAVRMFLRFLMASGHCPPGLDEAIPTFAQWRRSALPRYLPSEDIERIIAACDASTPWGARDKVILLLLARLGLRAGEVAGLRIHDIDWQSATVQVTDKNRRTAPLPLPQEVGDALLHYLTSIRPAIHSDKVFLANVAPLAPLSRGAISQVAARAIRRAGVNAPCYGSHVFRHSAATALLRQGASLQAIGALLRHSTIETTEHYAKVDVELLHQVTLPWPEGGSC